MSGAFDGKVALVTGARTGIGAATARLLAARGAHVVAAVRRPGDGDTLVTEIGNAGGRCDAVVMDAADPDAVARGIAEAAALEGRIDILVTSAGIEQPTTAPIDAIPIDEMQRVIATNLQGSWLAVHHSVPHIASGGAICLVSSLWGLLGGAGLTAYSATKGGVHALTRSLAVELGSKNVRVNCVSPGAILTPMLERFLGGDPEKGFNFPGTVPLGRPGKAEEVAEAIIWLCSDAAAYVTGQVLAADGGITVKMSVCP